MCAAALCAAPRSRCRPCRPRSSKPASTKATTSGWSTSPTVRTSRSTCPRRRARPARVSTPGEWWQFCGMTHDVHAARAFPCLDIPACLCISQATDVLVSCPSPPLGPHPAPSALSPPCPPPHTRGNPPFAILSRSHALPFPPSPPPPTCAGVLNAAKTSGISAIPPYQLRH